MVVDSDNDDGVFVAVPLSAASNMSTTAAATTKVTTPTITVNTSPETSQVISRLPSALGLVQSSTPVKRK